MAYYTADDLTKRRVSMATWICGQTHKLVNHYRYGQLVKHDFIMDYEYVVAALEAVECYTPITLASEDGETNCMTEANLDNLFSNFTHISGIDFLPVGTTYNPNNNGVPVPVALEPNAGGNLTLNSTPTDEELLIDPSLGLGILQLITTQNA